MITKGLLSIPATRQIVPVSIRTIYREVEAGRLKILKVGRRSFIAREDIERWLKRLEKKEGVK